MSDRVSRASGAGGAFSKFSEESRRQRRGLLIVVCAVVLSAALLPLLAQQISARRSRAAAEPGSVELVRKRAEWFFRQRASVNGHIPNGLLLQAFARNRNMVSGSGTFVEHLAALKVTPLRKVVS